MEARAYDPVDPGLFALEMLLRLRGIDADPGQLRRRSGRATIGVPEMLHCARDAGLKTKSTKTSWDRLGTLPLPGIAVKKDGGFLLVGKVSGGQAIVLAPGAARPSLMSRADFEPEWDGRIVLMTRRSGSAAALQRRWIDWKRRMAAAAHRAHLRFSTSVRLNQATLAKDAVQRSATVANAVILDFAERARKLRGAMGPRQPSEGRLGFDELAFLPAALEIVETPPSPIGRAIVFTIVAIFTVALGWACIGTVDVVAVSQGKIIPSTRTKVIQPFETGLVRAIRVADGQRVRAGDILIELDTTTSGADVDRLKGDLIAARLEAARLRAALDGESEPAPVVGSAGAERPDLVKMQRRFLLSQTAEQKAKIAAFDGQIAEKQAERATINATIDKLEAGIAPLEERVDIRRHLYSKELGSKLTYLSEYQELVSQQREVVVQHNRAKAIDSAIETLTETRSRAIAEYERGLLDELAKVEQKAAGYAQDIIKAEQRTSLQRLAAPVDGMVQQLAVHTIGGVVTPAQTLMLIVPEGSRLEIEAMISNHDIGFVEVGQDVAIKIDTFSFTRYGLLHGKVLTISSDAIVRDTGPVRAGVAPGTETASSEPKGQELVYAARVSLDRTQMAIENKRVNLSPGMAATVEIKTGSRSVISYLLSPLARYAQESLRER